MRILARFSSRRGKKGAGRKEEEEEGGGRGRRSAEGAVTPRPV